MNVELYELFFRDGSYAIDFGFTSKHMRVVGGAMEDAGFRFVEVGHGYGMGAERAGYPSAVEPDEAYLKTASKIFNRCAFGVFYIPGVGTPDDLSLAVDYGAKFVSIGHNITQIEEAEQAVLKAKSLGLQTTVCMMKAYVLSAENFEKKVKIAQGWEPDYIMIMDSAGNMTPEETAKRIRVIVETGKARAGFHGHDNLSLASVNSLTAVKNGALRIDVSLGGLGRSGGNVATQIMAALLEREGLGSNTSPKLDSLEPVMEAVRKAGLKIPGAPDMTNILLGLYGLHSSIAYVLNDTAKRFGLNRAKLYEKVAEQNRVNPAPEDITNIAKSLASG